MEAFRSCSALLEVLVSVYFPLFFSFSFLLFCLHSVVPPQSPSPHLPLPFHLFLSSPFSFFCSCQTVTGKVALGLKLHAPDIEERAGHTKSQPSEFPLSPLMSGFRLFTTFTVDTDFWKQEMHDTLARLFAVLNHQANLCHKLWCKF